MNKLYDILTNKDYYSISSKYIMEKLNINRNQLMILIKNTEKNKNCKINIFTYQGNNVEYIGLESRRIDYERDKKNGTNKIEKLIEKGYYDTKKENHNGSIILCFITLVIFGYFKYIYK